MKKQIIVGISIITCVALCAAVWPCSTEVEDLPANPVKTAVPANIEARSEETLDIFISEVTPVPELKLVVESEPQITKVTTEEKTETVPPTSLTSQSVSKSTPASTEPKSGDRVVIDGKPHVWIPGFGWIVDEGVNIGTTVGNPGDQLTGNKVGIMGGATVGSDGDINKQVGIMGGSTVAEDMYENGHKIGIVSDDESVPSSISPPAYAEPEITGDVIYVPLQPPVTKDSTPPQYKLNGEPYNP